MVEWDPFNLDDHLPPRHYPATMGDNWTWAAPPILTLPRRVVMEVVRQCDRWLPHSVLRRIDYEEVAGEGWVQCPDCELGYLEAVWVAGALVPQGP